MTPRVGVAISTRNRRDIFTESLAHWMRHLGDAVLVIVDDASDTPLPDIDGATIIRHQQQRGVAATKNSGIAALVDAGVEHLFLADDDVHPLVDNWWQPYAASPEHHLSYQWPRKRHPDSPYNKWRIIPQPGHPLERTHFAIGFPRGVMLYMDRFAVDTIGGMDPEYGRGEHVDWQYRAWLAGLTTFTQTDEHGETVAAYGDIRGSNTIWYARDEHEQIESTFGDVNTMRRLDRVGGRHWGRNWVDGKPAYFDPWTGERR